MAACCQDGTAGLYGLSFEDGTMVFKPLGMMATEPVGRQQEQGLTQTSGLDSGDGKPDAREFSTSQRLDWEIDLLSHLEASHVGVDGVQITLPPAGSTDPASVSIRMQPGGNGFAIRMAAESWLRQHATGLGDYRIQFDE